MTWKWLLCAAALSAACGSDEGIVAGDGPGSTTDGGLQADGGLQTDGGPPTDGAGGTAGCSAMDLLFVIDNSGSMREEQTSLAENFPRMISVLDALKGGTVDYRVGVTTTSVSDELSSIPFLTSPAENGALLQTSEMQNPWLTKGEPDLAARFTTLATVGLSGSGREQPLRAARAAVTERAVQGGSNVGFRRDNALLAVIVVTDEDDSSAGEGMLDPIFGFIPLPGSEIPVADFVASFDQATGGRGNWATAVIAGDQPGGCESAFGEASYAERLADFVQQTGSNGVLGSICQGDLASELDKALNLFTNACETFVPLF